MSLYSSLYLALSFSSERQSERVLARTREKERASGRVPERLKYRPNKRAPLLRQDGSLTGVIHDKRREQHYIYGPSVGLFLRAQLPPGKMFVIIRESLYRGLISLGITEQCPPAGSYIAAMLVPLK